MWPRSWPFGGVADGAFVAEFVELADVVEHGGGEEQIKVELGIVRRELLREAAETDDVFEQAADVGVVHDFGRRRALEARSDLGIGDDADDKGFQPGIADGFGVLEKPDVHLFDVFFGVRKKIDQVDFFGLGAADLLKRELRLVAINFDAGLHFYKSSRLMSLAMDSNKSHMRASMVPLRSPSSRRR